MNSNSVSKSANIDETQLLDSVLKLLADRSGDDAWINRQLGAQLAAKHRLIPTQPILLQLLTDPSEWVRLHALQSLLGLKVEPARILLYKKQLLADNFFRVRALAKKLFDGIEGIEKSSKISIAS